MTTSKILLAVAALIALSVGAGGQTVYVDVNSMSPSEDGSPANPYKSIAAGIAVASHGATIDVASGLYMESGLIVTNNLTIQGQPDLSTIISDPTPTGVFVIESINSDTTVRSLMFRDMLGMTAFGNDNSSIAPSTMTMEHCVVINLARGAVVNHTQKVGNLIVDYCTFSGCAVGVEENNANEIDVKNTIFDDCDEGVHGLDYNRFCVTYSLFSNVGDRAETHAGGTLPTLSGGVLIGDANLDVNGVPDCLSCAVDMGDPGGYFFNEPMPNGGTVNMGAYGNTAWATSSCGLPGPCIPEVSAVCSAGGPNISVPENLMASGANGVVTLDWDDESFLSFKVYRSEDGVFFDNPETVAVSEFTDDTVTIGMPYWYGVTTTDGLGLESSMSIKVSVVPMPGGGGGGGGGGDHVSGGTAGGGARGSGGHGGGGSSAPGATGIAGGGSAGGGGLGTAPPPGGTGGLQTRP